MNDQTQSLVRAVLKIGGGYVISRGIADGSTVEVIGAGMFALVGVVWGYYHRSPKP